MLATTFNLLPIVVSMLTGAGILLHDTEIDHATEIASTNSHVASHDGSFDNPAARLNDQTAHTHNEAIRYSESVRKMGNIQPRLNTRDTDIKKFMEKKLAFNSTA